MPRIVIQNLTLPEGARRAVVHPDALHDMTLRGWEPVGPAAEGADGIYTEAEWSAEVARRDAAVQAALAATPTTKKKG